MAAPKFSYKPKKIEPTSLQEFRDLGISTPNEPGEDLGEYENHEALRASEFEQTQSFRNLSTPSSSEDGESLWLLSYSDLMTLLFGFFVLLMSFSKIDVDSFEKVRKETTLTFGGEYKKPFADLKEKLNEKIQAQGLNDKAVFDDMEKGMTITFRGSVFFDPGSAELKADAVALIEKLIPVIKSRGTQFNVVVEGHTDDSPIHSEKFPSNWELSAQRASAVIRIFEKQGFGRAQLRAIGYADTMPVAPNRNQKGDPVPENQSQNRRVVLKLIRSKK